MYQLEGLPSLQVGQLAVCCQYHHLPCPLDKSEKEAVLNRVFTFVIGTLLLRNVQLLLNPTIHKSPTKFFIMKIRWMFVNCFISWQFSRRFVVLDIYPLLQVS